MRGFSLVLDLVLGCSCAALVGCGGAQATPPAEPAAAEVTSAPIAPANSGAVDAPPASDAAAEAADGPPKAKPKAEAEDPNVTREVTYVVVPEGIKVSLTGVKFMISAAAAQVGPGWGAKVSVVATAEDGKPHSLSSP